jgi:stage II sporulation protein AA (anti-sigma F factor antagonist)
MEKLRFSLEERLVAVSILEEIDHHAARSLREEIDRLLFKYRPKTLVLDFSSVRFMDSSGLGLIIGRAEISKSIGASLEIRGLSPMLLRLVRLGGVEKIENIRIV